MPPSKRAKRAKRAERAGGAREYRVWSELAFFMSTDYYEDEVFAGSPWADDVEELKKSLASEDLTEYLPPDLKRVIASLKFEVDEYSDMSNKLKADAYRNPCSVGLVAVVQAQAELSDSDKEELISYLSGQYSDGCFENGVAEVKNGTFQVFWDVAGLECFAPAFMDNKKEDEPAAQE